MRSPTAALLWEIWRRNRIAVAVIAATTVAGRLLDYAEQPTDDPSSLITLLWMVAFQVLFGIFSYTESNDPQGIGGFPRRLFTLPVSSLRLVALPVLTGIVSVELLYALWWPPLARGASVSSLFVAVLLAAMMVFFQATFWMLERLGPLRLMFAGGVAIVVYSIGLVPSWPPSPPPLWRSELAVGSLVAVLAMAAFLLAWNHIVRLRRGGGGGSSQRVEPRVVPAGGRSSPPRAPFASPAAAHFWFEWRSAGFVLPVLVAGVLALVIAPISWFTRNNAGGSLQLLLGTLAAPIVLAIPVGMAFARPTFWSEDLSLPAFIAIRPLTDEQIIAIKLKVAAASAAISWLLIAGFVGAWLSMWGNADSVSQLALTWWAFHEHSVVSVYATVALLAAAGVILTWRVLVSRLWIGMSGSRPLFIASVMSIVAAGIAGMVFAVDRLPGWVLEDPARMGWVVWLLAAAVVAKCGIAAYSWSRISTRHLAQYFLVWSAATACVLALAITLWDVIRIYAALDIYRFQGLMILAALLAVPLARIGLAPSSLARNRHR